MPTSPVAAVQDQGLQAVDYLVVAVYLLSVLAVGLYFFALGRLRFPDAALLRDMVTRGGS